MPWLSFPTFFLSIGNVDKSSQSMYILNNIVALEIKDERDDCKATQQGAKILMVGKALKSNHHKALIIS